MQHGYACLCDPGWHYTSNVLDVSASLINPACSEDVDECSLFYNDLHLRSVAALAPTPSGSAGTGAGSGSQATPADANSTLSYPCSMDPFVQCVNWPGSFGCSNCPKGESYYLLLFTFLFLFLISYLANLHDFLNREFHRP